MLPICVASGDEDRESLPISTLEPMGYETCMTRARSSPGTGISSGPSPKVWMTSKSPPKTER